jgi:hypothetical protein
MIGDDEDDVDEQGSISRPPAYIQKLHARSLTPFDCDVIEVTQDNRDAENIREEVNEDVGNIREEDSEDEEDSLYIKPVKASSRNQPKNQATKKGDVSWIMKGLEPGKLSEDIDETTAPPTDISKDTHTRGIPIKRRTQRVDASVFSRSIGFLGGVSLHAGPTNPDLYDQISKDSAYLHVDGADDTLTILRGGPRSFSERLALDEAARRNKSSSRVEQSSPG